MPAFKNTRQDACGVAYVLGHSDAELLRLTIQARLLEPITRRYLQCAGITPGMRVLDVGCGTGDVALLAAELVSNSGEVVGADRAASAVAVARERAKARSVTNVSFLEGDPSELRFDRPFDAVVGRYVLMYQPDPAAFLRALATSLRPDGILVFHELDWGGVRSTPSSPTYDQCCRWVIEGLRCGDAEAYLGTRLYSVFVRAGLPPPVMRLEAIVGGAADSSGSVRDLIDTIFPISLVSALERSGVATAAEIDAATLPDRMYDEIARNGSVIVGRSEVRAWSRVGMGGLIRAGSPI